jgi:hypothetical protein
MTDVTKSVEAILKSPGHIAAALLIWSLVLAIFLSTPIADWPTTFVPQTIVRLTLASVALLSGLILLTKLVDWLLRPLLKSIAITANIMRGRKAALGLKEQAQTLLAYMIHSADSVVYYPMGIDSCLEIEAAAVVRRTATAFDVAQLEFTEQTRLWLAADYPWAIANLKLNADVRVTLDQFTAGMWNKFHDRI